MADADGDGKISFAEYMFFSILLTTGNTLMKKLFDNKENCVTK